MASLNYFYLLSIELIQHILLQFTCPSDLLSLALTERMLCSIIIPEFLEYCRLRFDVNRLDIWKHLNERTLLCSRVRHLELLRGLPPPLWGSKQWGRFQRKAMVPRVLLSNTEDGSLDIPYPDTMSTCREACGALRKMCNLKRIAFNNDEMPWEFSSSQNCFAFAFAVYDASQGSIENISFGISISAEPTESEFLPLILRRILSDSNWLSSLKSCYISLPYNRDDDNYNSEFDANFENALSQMVNVTHLRLINTNWSSQPSDEMMPCWPKLEWFYLQRSPISNFLQIPFALRYFHAEFIRNHHRLHTLFVSGANILPPSQVDSEDVFKLPTPGLKSLGYMCGQCPQRLRKCLPLSVLRNLSHFTYRPVFGGDLNLFDELESLESCIIKGSPFSDETLVVEITKSMSRGCKNLKKLWFESTYLFFLEANDRVFSHFEGLPNLTHLLGLYSDRRPFPGHEGDELLKRLYTKLPKLRYFDCAHEIPNREWRLHVELRRNDMLQRMEYEFLDLKSVPDSCDPHRWSGFDIVI